MRLWSLLLFALPLAAQTPTFEVASIRPSKSLITPSLLCGSLQLSTDTVLASGVYRLDNLVVEAYRSVVDDFDLPQWLRNNGTFAVSVSIPPNTDIDTCRLMLQNLLAERFHMVTDVEPGEVGRYYLSVAKSGLRLKPVDGPPADPNDSVSLSVRDGLARRVFRGASASHVVNAVRTAALIDASARSFASGDRSFRIVSLVDETGLTGYYDGELQYTNRLPSRRDQFPEPESVEDAVARQLGLTLEFRRVPGKILVLRSSDRMPTEN